MRHALVCFAVLTSLIATPVQAQAQDEGLGPYRFGMSMVEAQATSPTANWRLEEASPTVQILQGGPQVAMGARFDVMLVFAGDALDLIGLVTRADGVCADIVPTLVTELEPVFGLFDSAPGVGEAAYITEVAHTAAGSELRFSTVRPSTDSRMLAAMRGRRDAEQAPAPSANIYSTRRTQTLVQVAGTPVSDNPQACDLSVSLNPARPYAGPATSVTYAQLDEARTLVNPRWRREPTASTRLSTLPEAARDPQLLEAGAGAVLDCLIDDDGALACLVASETPVDAGLGEAALQLAQTYRAARIVDGEATAGKRVRLPVNYSVLLGQGVPRP